MTPAELNCMLEGYQEKRRERARLVSYIINYTGRLSKPLTADDILGVRVQGYGRKLPKEKIQKEREWLKQMKEKEKHGN